ncbi:hypothetical protein BASA62_004168 [Batrachochytrium salamandrivorans]|nr:hypothetical protein BASA62_004168 [Batrachochytrium salamandrivorans]
MKKFTLKASLLAPLSFLLVANSYFHQRMTTTTYQIAYAKSIFEIFENPALEDIDDFPSAISFDIALFDIFETPALEDIDDSPSATSFDVSTI